MVNYDDFKKLELRVAEIETVNIHPNADKLYVLGIRIGEERRTIVAGIRLHYPENELIGKKIVIVYNLEPAIIRGVESQGMLLAAHDAESFSLISVDRPIASGASIR